MHCSHAVPPSSDWKDPAAHLAQLSSPVPFAKEPAAHAIGAVAPIKLNVPGGVGSHADAALLPVACAVLELFPLVESGSYTALAKSLADISAVLVETSAADDTLKVRASKFRKGPLDALKAAGKVGEASPTAKAMLKVADGLVQLIG
mgnify:CR=1 FL=1